MATKENDVNLTNSPIYNISMCSLENFHTCFWKWLGNTYKKEFLNVMIGKNILDEENIKCTDQVSLSGFKLDLEIRYIEDNREKRVIIENKIKSFPTNEQLEKYAKEAGIENTIFILTSLAPKFDIRKQWSYLSYSAIAENMCKIFNNKFQYKNDYHKYLIQDYINVIMQLSQHFPHNNSQKYDFYEENEVYKVGLRDIYVKWRTSEFTNYIKKYLNEKDYYINHSFHNKKGTIDIVKNLEISQISIGIQIENNQYRYFMNIPNVSADIREKIASELFYNGYWFNDTQDTKRNTLYKKFCGYNPDFIYRYFQMDEYFGKELQEISYEEVTKQIEKDINNLEENQYRIIRILAENL